jgi:ribonuclease R
MSRRLSSKTKGLDGYAVEIPTREQVIEAVAEEGPVDEPRLREILRIEEEQLDGFERRLAAMERDGQIVRNRRGMLIVADKAGLVKGKVIGHADGFGFLKPEDGSDDLFLAPKQMHKVLHGDLVLARVVGVDRRGRLEGGIVEVLERANRKVVGRLYVEHGVAFVVAENKRINQDILLQPESLAGAKEGQVVVAEILEQPTKHAEPIGRVVEILGNYADPGMEIEIALRKHDLPHEFSKQAMNAAARLPKAVADKDLKGRRDLRGLAFVTIDGETARDFDDAVYCETLTPAPATLTPALSQGRGRKAEGGGRRTAPSPLGEGGGRGSRKSAAGAKGFRLWVAIADVSNYVKPGDPLDMEGYERGNSVYFPRRVIPMLPEELSNELCSLKPEVDRLVMVCEMEVTAGGVVRHYEFYPGVIHSHARLTYTRVAALIEGKEPDPPIGEDVVPNIENLYAVFKALLGARLKRGAIDFDSVETRMIFDEQGKIERIVRVERNDAHRLIEECMLAANVCASEYLGTNEQPTLYRVHEGPTMDKLEALRAMLKDFGLTLGGGDKPEARDYAELLSRIKDKPFSGLLQTVMLRSLAQAVYTPENVGHFGLAYEAYAHFTSPIRRYPDLLVHRGIKAVIAGKRYDAGELEAIGRHCSETERRADEATRDVEAWLKCYFMQDHVGDEFDGTVSGVTSFGLFVTLDELYVDGLVHISDLGQDYFQFDAQRHLLRGERSGVRYQLGGRVRVRVVRVNLEQAKIDFVLVEMKAEGKRTMAEDPFSEDDEEQDLMPHLTGKPKKKGGKR